MVRPVLLLHDSEPRGQRFTFTQHRLGRARRKTLWAPAFQDEPVAQQEGGAVDRTAANGCGIVHRNDASQAPPDGFSKTVYSVTCR
jgi:hypothetical protein